MKNARLFIMSFALIMLAIVPCFAQTSEYGFSATQGTYTAITDGVMLGTETTDDQRFVDPATPAGGTTTTGVGFPIGFSFTFNSVVFDRLAINANGWISLGQSALTPSVNNASSSAYTPISSTTVINPDILVNRIAAFSRDLQAQTGATIRLNTIGTAPNRVCVVQWENYKKYGTSGTGDNFNFQIQLHETTNNVKIVYGAIVANATAGNMQVGLRGPLATDFNARQGDASWNNTTAATANNQYVVLNDVNYPVNGLTFNFNYPVANQAPNPANLSSPADAATLVSPFTSLNWTSGGGLPTGYRIFLGTNNPPTNIVNNQDLGAVNTYTPNPVLNISTTYYWKIVPYNAFGDAVNCPVWSFTTHGDASVSTLPYTQHWDSVTAPELPFDWTAIVQSSTTAAYVKTVTTTPHTTPNTAALFNSTDLNGQILLVSPQIANTLTISSVRVKFWGRAGTANSTLSVGVMTNPLDPTTYTEVQSIAMPTTTWTEYAAALSPYTGQGRFIAFKHPQSTASRTLYVDEVTFEEIAPNDLAALSISGNTTPSVGTASNYTVRVLNNGTASQSTYTVKLFTEAGIELASVAGPTIAPGIVADVIVPWTPTTQGPLNIYAKVILSTDINTTNDQTPMMAVSVQPEGVMSVTVGTGELAEGIPWEFYYKNSLYQTLYYSTEMGMFGNITAISFYNNFVTNLPDKPIKLWLGTTQLEDLSAGWILPDQLSLVYDGTMNFPSGENTITIPLQVPFNYAGGNLVLYANRPMDTAYFSSSDNFQAQTVGTNRARKLQSDSVTYDPAAPSAAGTLSGTFPKTTFIMTPLSPNPLFVVNPASKNFGNVVLGTTANQNFFVANAGGGVLNVNSISISGSPFFTLTNLPTLPQNLSTGQVLGFGVAYAPTTAGNHAATISITDNRMVHTVELTGVGFDTNIYTMPYSQNFDSVTVPALPIGWSSIYQASVTTGYVKTVTTSPQSLPNCVAMYNPTDTATIAMLIAPPVAPAIPINTVRVKMWGKGNNYSVKVGVMSDPGNADTFSEVQTLTFTSAWAEYAVPLTGYTGNGRFIAFKHANNAAAQTIYLDTIELELIGANDLAAISIAGPQTPTVGSPTNYDVNIYNNGTATQNAYTVKIIDGSGNELASVAGQPIAANENLNVSMTITPTAAGTLNLRGVVELTGDINPGNNTSPALNSVVMPAGTVTVTIGTGGLYQGVPFEFYNNNSLFETVYLQSEIGIYGVITSLNFYNRFVSDAQNKPIKIWLGTTDLENLSGGWILPDQLTLVYDGTMNFPIGQNVINIPLQTNFNYFTGNLVMMANRPMDTTIYNTNDDFIAQTVGTNRSRKLSSNTVNYDPAAPSAAGTLSGTFPKTTFGFTMDGLGSLSGTVTSGGNPVSGVLVSINTTTLTQTTSATGQYGFPYLLVGAYTLTASKIGYETQTLPFTIVEGQTTTVNISLVASASVNVTGSVFGSDNPGVGLSEATINLNGVINYTGTTNAAGQFTIANVLSGNTYNYVISRAGYQNLTGSIIVGSTNYAMGNLVLNELTLPPAAVTATLNPTETAVNVTWRAPGNPGNFEFFDFESDNGGWVASSNWTDPIGDWEWTGNYNVTNWNPTYTGTSVVPPPIAYSGTGMWGTKINTNYTNSGGFNYLTKTFNFSGYTNAQIRFRSWENVFGNFDYAQLSVNGTLVWGPSWDYTGTQWQERIVDLSAFDGMAEVTIQFQMWATTTVNYAGWYIDDIHIGSAERSVATSVPAILPDYLKRLSEVDAAKLVQKNIRNESIAIVPLTISENATRIPMGYKVWRLLQGQEQTPDIWTLLTTNTINDTAWVDPSWPTLPDGEYKWAVKTVYTGNVLSNPGFSNMLRKRPNELSALTISGNVTPSHGSVANYTVRIKNTGTGAQVAGAYTVKIMTGTTELASVSGPAIAVNQEIDVVIPWTPLTEGVITIFGRVLHPNDTILTNNDTPPLNVMVFPSGQFAYTVGDGSINSRVPMDMYYKNSLFQSLYYPAEISNFMGFINAIQFYNNFITDLQNKPTKVYIGTTTLADLSEGWIPTTDHTLVFDGNVNYPSGLNVITIPFIQPYMYLNGENLVVTVLRPTDTQYYNTNDTFKAQTVGTNRARKAYSDTIAYDPLSPPAPTATQLSGTFPMTTFLGIPGGVGHLSGTVMGPGNQPLADVNIAIQNTTYQTVTSVDGQYQINNILPGAYTVNYTKYGYISHTANINIVEDETTSVMVTMNAMPVVYVSGTVLASDTGMGLAGASINLIGYANYNASTTGSGTFSISAVYANEAYQYSIQCPGYTSTSGTINVGATNHQMGNITLNEIAYAPHALIATLNASYTGVDLAWQVPDPTAVEITESFEGNEFPPADWGQTITNTGEINTSGVYPTFCKFGTIQISGNPVNPTHGSFQSGLWWSYDHQDEWLITPSFNCPPDAYLLFDSYVFLGSTSGDHYYVKASTDGGNTWTPLWDASTQIGGWNYYDAPINIDLSAYSGLQLTLAFNAEDPPTNDGLWYVWFLDNLYIGNAITPVSFDNPSPITISRKLSGHITPDHPSRDGAFIPLSRMTSVHDASTKNDRLLTGYNVFRLISGQEANEAGWVNLTPEQITATNFSDDSWGSLPNGSYRWAVKAIYTAGVSSAAAFSNTLVKENVTGTIVGFVRRSNNVAIPGATVSAGTYSTTANNAGAYSLILPVGSYSVTATAAGFHPRTIDGVVVSPNQNTTLNIVMTSVANEDEVSPVTATMLQGNMPNPFNPETTIRFDIKETSPVRLEIYNVKGQKIRTLIAEDKSSGRYSIVWNAKDDDGNTQPSGVYFYRFTAGTYSSTKKMLLME